jgi:hypothetical protein
MILNVTIDRDGQIPAPQLDAVGKIAALGPAVAQVAVHGWWNGFDSSADLYDQVLAGCALRRRELRQPEPSELTVLCHWPSMLSEDERSPLNLCEPLSFWAMEHRADRVGRVGIYRVMTQILDRVPGPVLLQGIGHSFGCEAVMSGFAMLSQFRARCAGDRWHATLLQAAFPARNLEPGWVYGPLRDRLDGCDLTISPLDNALGTFFPLARLAELSSGRAALGYLGPTPPAVAAWERKLRVVNVADQQRGTSGFDGPGGHHSDLLHPVFFDLINNPGGITTTGVLP